MTRALMVGLSSVFVRYVDGQIPERSIVVLEEPDLIRKRSLEDLPERYPCVAEVVPATYQQGGDFLEVALRVHERWGVQAVLPSLEYSVPAAAELAEKLGLPGAGARAAAALRDKLMLREATSRAGMAAPQWREIDGPEAIMAFARDRSVVVKPADRQASLGVHVLDRVTPEVAGTVWAAMRAAEEGGVPERPMRRRYMVETRLTGPEYSVEAVVRGGRLVFDNVTEKRTIPGVHPVEIGHVVPAPIDDDLRARLVGATATLVDAVGFDTGILHAEWFYRDGEPVIVECAARCPGDHLMMLMDLAYDTSMRPALIRMHAGHDPRLPRSPRRAAAIEFVRAEPGRVVRVEGEAEARALPGVHEVKVTVEPSASITPWSSSWDRHGYAVAVGDTAEQARRRAERAAATVRIVTRATTPT